MGRSQVFVTDVLESMVLYASLVKGTIPAIAKADSYAFLHAHRLLHRQILEIKNGKPNVNDERQQSQQDKVTHLIRTTQFLGRIRHTSQSPILGQVSQLDYEFLGQLLSKQILITTNPVKKYIY